LTSPSAAGSKTVPAVRSGSSFAPPAATAPSRSRSVPHHHRSRPLPDDLRKALETITHAR